MFTPIHKHLLVKAIIGKPLEDVTVAKEFLTTLVTKIRMNPVTEPQAVYVAEEGNEGFTGSINLATSHIAFHIWDKTKLLMLDVYSCKDFTSDEVLAHIHEYMNLDQVHFIVIDRENFSIKEEYEQFN